MVVGGCMLALFGPHLSFFWYLGRAVFCHCDISLVSSLTFLQIKNCFSYALEETIESNYS